MANPTALSASPGAISPGSTGNLITLTGLGTSWVAGTPGSPTFTLSGGLGASITAQTVGNSTSAIITVTAGTETGTLTITDPSTNNTVTLSVSYVTWPQTFVEPPGLSLIADQASEISNSYTTVAFANAYWANDYRSANVAQWAALANSAKTNLMIQACKVIETARFTVPVTLPQYAMHYDRRTHLVLSLNLTRTPVKFYYYQRLQFPRNLDVYYLTPPTGAALGDLYIPEDILIAQCEQAMYMLNLDQTALANRIQGVVTNKVVLGNNAVGLTQEYTTIGSMFSPMALEIVRPYMFNGGKMQRA